MKPTKQMFLDAGYEDGMAALAEKGADDLGTDWELVRVGDAIRVDDQFADSALVNQGYVGQVVKPDWYPLRRKKSTTAATNGAPVTSAATQTKVLDTSCKVGDLFLLCSPGWCGMVGSLLVEVPIGHYVRVVSLGDPIEIQFLRPDGVSHSKGGVLELPPHILSNALRRVAAPPWEQATAQTIAPVRARQKTQEQLDREEHERHMRFFFPTLNLSKR